MNAAAGEAGGPPIGALLVVIGLGVIVWLALWGGSR